MRQLNAMNCKNLLLLTCLLVIRFTDSETINKTPFPDDFMFGISTGAYQIEGGWNADGRGESIWDHMCHNKPKSIVDKSNGDVACDSYHNYMEDVEILKDLRVNHYRFSISWTRILPTGFANKINPAGVKYYKNLIKLLKDNNIEPVVTIYHWDLPQKLQDGGGWPNNFIIDVFVDYARICFELFGDDVKYWITVNEPIGVCYLGYGKASYAPGVNLDGIADYWCAHNILKAHSKVWHLYDEQFRKKQKGKVGITIDSFWYEPDSSSEDDKTASETSLQFTFGWFFHPISKGGYPKIMVDRIANRSKLEGFPRSRLPSFTKKEISYMKGTYDFLGYNYYNSFMAKAIPEQKVGQPSFLKDIGVEFYQPSDWVTGSGTFKDTPWGLRKILNWIKNHYNNPVIFITENGIPTSEGLNDNLRINFIQGHLSSLRNAMIKDEVRVIGYTAWTLMDDFEWASGYTTKFGLYQTNFSDPRRTRTPKKSAFYYKKVIEAHGLDTDRLSNTAYSSND